jgi:Kdo2-lipid IVA lauroyltransferase/acyltransferase
MLFRLLARLPFGALYTLARPLYWFLYYVAGYRKAVVKQNLSQAFPDQSENELTVLAKNFYRQLAQVSLEIIKTPNMKEEDFRQRVQLVNPELLRECSDNLQRSVILMAIHQGNWEWMLHGVSIATGICVDPVYKPLHSKAANQLMLAIRRQFGAHPIPMAALSADLLRHRREFRVLGMVADQSPIRGERSYWTTFLNGEAAFFQGAEVIAQTAGFAVVFAQCRRLRRGHYEIEFHELARPSARPSAQPPLELGATTITERYVRLAEQAIRSEPQSWLWSHRRWKRQRER